MLKTTKQSSIVTFSKRAPQLGLGAALIVTPLIALALHIASHKKSLVVQRSLLSDDIKSPISALNSLSISLDQLVPLISADDMTQYRNIANLINRDPKIMQEGTYAIAFEDHFLLISPEIMGGLSLKVKILNSKELILTVLDWEDNDKILGKAILNIHNPKFTYPTPKL